MFFLIFEDSTRRPGIYFSSTTRLIELYDNREDVVSSIGEKRHVETPSGRDVCQVPCRTTSSFLCDTFFRPASTPTATCLWKMAPRFGVFLGFCLLGVKFCFMIIRIVDTQGSLWIFLPRCVVALRWWFLIFFRSSAPHFACCG